jgi:eukaryotic-like serine/threonine-protein kinase
MIPETTCTRTTRDIRRWPMPSTSRYSTPHRFTSERRTSKSARELYVRPFPGLRGKWQVSTGGGREPRWSRDGKELFYVALDGKLMAVSIKEDSALDVGTPKALFEPRILGGARTILGVRHQYYVTPDGQRFSLTFPLRKNPVHPLPSSRTGRRG